MSPVPQIYVLICTLDDGILRVPDVLRPAEEGVRYIVGWQQTGLTEAGQKSYPEDLNRGDVTVSTMQGRGLCRNRNHVMEVAFSQMSDPMANVVFVIADDDERLEEDAFKHLRELYSSYPKLDIALLQVADLVSGNPLKRYVPNPIDYRNRPRSYYPSSVELTFRSRVYLTGLRFDERFGLGSDRLSAGEEDVFLADALHRGLRIWLYPRVLCRTSCDTTGSRNLDVKVLRSKGAVYGYRHSLLWAFFRSWREAISLGVRKRRAVLPIFRNIWYGVKYIRQ